MCIRDSILMDTTYIWKIANLERETADGYVFTAHYTVDAALQAQLDEKHAPSKAAGVPWAS